MAHGEFQITDVTLREGNQLPGRDYGADARVAAARRLDDLGVGAIEAGFPVASDADREVFERLDGELDATTVALCRARAGDVDVAVESGADCVNVFAPLSELQARYTLHKTPAEVRELIVETIEHASDYDVGLRLNLVDAFRTDVEDVVAAIEAVPDDVEISLADTVGARTPTGIVDVLDQVADAGVERSRIGVHCHDDLGVGTANALAAYRWGAGGADLSVAGLGERAGNVPLEEVIVAAATSGDPLDVDESELVPVCRDVLTELDEWDAVPDSKAIIGERATSHESGIHTQAMLEEPSTFEAYDPTHFGGSRSLLFGRQTGRRAAVALLERAGADPTDDLVEELLDRLEEVGPIGEDAAVELAGEVSGEER